MWIHQTKAFLSQNRRKWLSEFSTKCKLFITIKDRNISKFSPVLSLISVMPDAPVFFYMCVLPPAGPLSLLYYFLITFSQEVFPALPANVLLLCFHAFISKQRPNIIIITSVVRWGFFLNVFSTMSLPLFSRAGYVSTFSSHIWLKFHK